MALPTNGVEVGSPHGGRWERADVADATAREALDRDILRVRQAAGDGSLFHDLGWLLEAEDRNPDDVEVFIFRRDGGAVAYAPFIVQPWSLRFRVGEITLLSYRLQRFHMNGGPLVADADANHLAPAIVESLLTELRPRLKSDQAVYLEGVPVGGPVESAIASDTVRAVYRVIEPSPRYERQMTRFPATFDAYMRSLKTQTRQNLRNGQRKLERHLSGDVRLVTCAVPSDVATFVEKATAVSRKTYQWHLLGLGLRDPARLERTLRSMAERGWTRCYLLECKGTPVAFMLGYLYGETYYYVDVGFDPDWEKWSVGTILHLAVFQDLIEGPQRARWFDFSSGTGVHKRRFGNESRAEANYLLLPRTLRNTLLVGCYRSAEALADGAVRVVDKFGLKAKIKKLMRRRATAAPGVG